MNVQERAEGALSISHEQQEVKDSCPAIIATSTACVVPSIRPVARQRDTVSNGHCLTPRFAANLARSRINKKRAKFGHCKLQGRLA